MHSLTKMLQLLGAVPKTRYRCFDHEPHRATSVFQTPGSTPPKCLVSPESRHQGSRLSTAFDS